MPGIDVTSWYGLLAPRATPKPVQDALYAVTSDILRSQALLQKLQAQGLSVKPRDRDLARPDPATNITVN